LGKNEFLDYIPDDVYNLRQLEYLFIGHNDFLAGEIPADIGSRLPALRDLSFQSSNRIRRLPESMVNLTKLTLLDLTDNALTGPIPETLGNIPTLQFLFLNKNNFSGTVPESIQKASELSIVLLNSNSITGNLSGFCQISNNPRDIIQTLVSDCDNDGDDDDTSEVQCPCCTTCCTDNISCDVDEFYGEQDPIWDYNYTRENYLFNNGQPIYPVKDPPTATNFYIPPPPGFNWSSFGIPPP
jgi:hypothetical protein